MNEDLFRQIDQRILDMQLETVQCLLAATKRSDIKPSIRERIEESARKFHGLAAFTEPDPAVAFADLVRLDPHRPDFRTLAEPVMRRIRGTPYLIPSAVAQEFLAALPEGCWGE